MPIKRRRRRSWSKKSVYRGDHLRSTWEHYLAKLLYYSDIDYKFEPQRFIISKGLTYLPDFYLPKFKTWIEVKGYLSAKDEVRIRMFKLKYTPRLIYFGDIEIEEIHGNKASDVSKLDFDNFIPSTEELARFHRFLKRQFKEFLSD